MKLEFNKEFEDYLTQVAKDRGCSREVVIYDLVRCSDRCRTLLLAAVNEKALPEGLRSEIRELLDDTKDLLQVLQLLSPLGR